MSVPTGFGNYPPGVTDNVLLPEKYLEVGLTADHREVVINHPDLLPDSNGVGHIVFSPAQARNLARLLLRKADLCLPAHQGDKP